TPERTLLMPDRTHAIAAISIGRNPTFNETALSVEAFLLEFAGELYGHDMRMEFLEWLRSQQKFDSPQTLADQIKRDVARTREIFTAYTRQLRGISPIEL